MKHKTNRVRAGRVHTALAKAVARIKRTPGLGFALLLAGISFLVATIDGAAAAASSNSPDSTPQAHNPAAAGSLVQIQPPQPICSPQDCT